MGTEEEAKAIWDDVMRLLRLSAQESLLAEYHLIDCEHQMSVVVQKLDEANKVIESN